MTPKQIARFWAKVDMSGGPDACWPWMGARNAKGYGYVSINYRVQPAHRTAEEIVRGPMPSHLQACHHCDYPPCCNPAHLFRGTGVDNSADKFVKGRDRVSTVKAADVLRIRAEYAAGASKQELMAKYGLGYYGVYAIVNRLTWRYI